MLDEAEKARVDAASRELWQGDLLATPVAVLLETPASTVTEGAELLDPIDEEGLWAPAAMQIASGWTAIVTQTCDVVRSIDDINALQLMPVVELSEPEWHDAVNGRRGTLFSLPPTEDLGIAFPAIDCAISFPVSKAALAHPAVRTLNTPMDPATRILLSHWLMRRVGRYAFSDELEQHVLTPLRNKVGRAMGKNSPGGALSSCLIGVWSSTEWAASASIIFVVDPNRLNALGFDIDLDKAADELLGPTRKALGKAGQPVQITRSVRSLEGVSAFDLMIAHRQVDLDQLPTGDFAAKDTIAALAASGSD